MCNGNSAVRNKQYKIIPPDGGWGYMICVAAIINYCSISMFGGSYSIIYKEFMEQQRMTSKTVTFLTGMDVMLLAIAAYLINPLLGVMNLRLVALIGSFLFNLGTFCIVFVNTTPLFFVCQGLQCSGMGILCAASWISVNDYFLEKRFFAVSLTQTCSAAAAMVAPELVEVCLRTLGYRNTLIVISAIAIQTFVAVALMQPVSRHLLKVEVEDVIDETVLLVDGKSAVKLTARTKVIKPLMTSSNDTGLPLEEECANKTIKRSRKFCSDLLDVATFKKFLSSNASMGPCICFFGENIFTIMLPQAFYSWGLTEAQTAHAVSLISFGDVITRASFVLTSQFLARLGHQEVYIAFVCLAFVSRIMVLCTDSLTVVMIFVTGIGIAHCAIIIMPHLILAECFGPEQFPKAVGLYLLVSAVLELLMGMVFGAIRDFTQSYKIPFYVATCVYPILILLWVIEIIYEKKRKRRLGTQQEEILG
ncbi:hypothetical protein O0L34_g9858 [Tuta absoluta]|nr:hypothetical protein O0L34_g9858 [Tuta absoluta]